MCRPKSSWPSGRKGEVMRRRNGNTVVELIMVMMLVTLFGTAVYSIIYTGSESQAKITEEKDIQVDVRIALSYINVVLRQNDEQGKISVKVNPASGENALVIRFDEDGGSYEKWIYSENGSLVEFTGVDGELPNGNFFIILGIPGEISIDYDPEANSVTNTVTYDYNGTQKHISQTVSLRSDVPKEG